jgi:hypothetical protein
VFLFSTYFLIPFDLVRAENILCDKKNHRLSLTNFGNALDLDPPRVGLDNDSLAFDAPGSIANTLAADVFSVAFIICRLLFDVPDGVLNQQLTSAGFDLDLWLQQTLAAAGSNLMGLSDALDYLRQRRGIWGLLKTAIRPNPLRKVMEVALCLAFCTLWSGSAMKSPLQHTKTLSSSYL